MESCLDKQKWTPHKTVKQKFWTASVYRANHPLVSNENQAGKCQFGQYWKKWLEKTAPRLDGLGQSGDTVVVCRVVLSVLSGPVEHS